MSCLPGRRLDEGEEVALIVHVACCRDAVHGAKEFAGVPSRQRVSGEFPGQVLVVGARASVESEEQFQEEPDAVGGVEASGEGLAVPVVLYGAVERVGVGVEPGAGVPERLLGAQSGLVGEDPGDASVEPVEHDLGSGEGVAFEAGHPRRTERGEGDDDEIEFRGAVAREPGEIGRRVFGEDHVQVVVGVPGDHAFVGSGAFEDEADDGRISGGELDKRVVGEWLSGHCADLRWSGSDGQAWLPGAIPYSGTRPAPSAAA
ncbi:hypothetical protein GCM10022295_48720 [Streptomyces osmaniensis]|uniref:Uncharacterized protein n=1 Tax=Streptomyces osmaniensis TaxID=593134 RepID=A0ABP6X497_9ACTN